MRARIGRITLGTALALVVAGGLTFGAREAFGSAPNAAGCQRGLCPTSDSTACSECCVTQLGYSYGVCTANGTCLCAE